MAGVRLEFAQFGDFDSFDIHRSLTPMTNVNNLPSPIVTNLSRMFYVDTTVVEGTTYYYRVVAWRDGGKAVSDEVEVEAYSGPVDIYWNYVSSLLHFNGPNDSSTFTDEKMTGWYRNGTPVISSTQSKFGGSSGRFTNNNYISNGNMAPFLFSASEDFTVEAWLFVPTGASIYEQELPIICIGAQDVSLSGGGWNLCLFDQANGIIRLERDNTNNTAQAALFYIGSTIPRDTWMHVEFGRASGITYGFFNGVLKGTSTVHNNIPFNSPNIYNVSIGSGNARTIPNNWHLDGYIDELRITKGVCRHTASFTPETFEYPNRG